MTLTDLNISLQQLASKQNRESILDFAFALMDWMGVEPNSGNTPQLLAPKTQKLKEYLENAPKSVQSQLYRISADSQPIRVRFAVLKKLKKDYISQLVDNDPGAESYQNTPAPLRSITKAPYFIHFVATPAYDKLVLIFNQGDQKRVVSFRSRLTNTQYNKIIQQWQNIASRNKAEIADLFWKSLDIKEVNKEFYKQIKERFDALIGIVKTQSAKATENQIKQFTVRLIGRYIFCWFLKEKGIISQDLIGKKSLQATKDFYQNVLLKLFFETLNTKVQDRNPLTHEKLFEKIPYLNGGLFDESDEDKLFRDLQLDDWLKPFVEILESYDFTVDESSSQYQQVAVDPEMLGRIFENLLASQNAETEKLANQRKAFGAFYTPREVVDYMVNESLKSYLASDLKIEREELNPAFVASPSWPEKLKSKKLDALKAIERIKILDFACGSGAFPMSTLHKLVELHELLGTVKSSYELKKEILSHNIYGVDIMPMAIEIARLRAWLSLVLEEDYKPNDHKHNFGLKPLPNLDFKFVCANSLFDSGFDTIYTKYIADEKIARAESMINLSKEIPELIKVRDQFFDAALVNKKKKDIIDEYNLKKEQIKKDFSSLRRNFKEVNMFLDNIDKWDPFDESKISPFFSPTWMFGIDKGFDIVIGNPPYIGEKGHSEIFDVLKSTPKWKEYYRRRSNTYYFFIKLGLDFLKNGGIQSLIIPREFTSADWSNKVRKEIIENSTILEIIDFANSRVFEDAGTSSLILIHQKGALSNYSFRLKTIADSIEIHEALNDKTSSINYSVEKIRSVDHKPWSFNDFRISYSDKIVQLGSLFNISQGLVTGADKVTPKHIEKGFIDKRYLGRGIFILEDQVDIKFNGRKCSLLIDDDWIEIDKSDKDCIKPYYKPEHLNKWNLLKTTQYVIYSNDKPLSTKLIKYLSQFRTILINRSTTIDDKRISFTDFEKFTIEDIKRHYSSAGAVQKIMRRKKWYLPLYERSDIPFDKPKILVNTKNMDVFTYSPMEVYSSGGGSGGQNYIYPKVPSVYFSSLDKVGMLEDYVIFINAVLNSKVIQSLIKSSQFNQLSTSKISDLPIPKINLEDKNHLAILKKIVNTCKSIIKMDLQDKDNTAIHPLEFEIDELLYKLYDLSFDEVA